VHGATGDNQVLSKANRVARADDFRAAVRTGNRVAGEHFVVYVRRTEAQAAKRFGFIVAKNIGSAVARNRVRRRLRAASSTLVVFKPAGVDVVIRALPGSEALSWTSLQEELIGTIERGQNGK
jgi:ribonuclease P protein component